MTFSASGLAHFAARRNQIRRRRANLAPEQKRIYIWIDGIKILRSIRAAPIEPDQAHRRFHFSRDFL